MTRPCEHTSRHALQVSPQLGALTTPYRDSAISLVTQASRNIYWNYLGTVVGLIVYFLLTPVVVSQLGTIGFGMWVLLNAVLFYLKFLDLGYYNALVRHIAETSPQSAPPSNSMIEAVARRLAVAGMWALLGCCLVAFWLVPYVFNVPEARIAELQLASLLIGINLAVAFPASVFSAVLEGHQRFDALGIISILVTIVGGAASAAVLLGGLGLIALATVGIFSTLLHALASQTMAYRICPRLSFRFGFTMSARQRECLRQIRSYSTWTSMNEVLAEGSAQLEKLLIPVLLSLSLLTPYTLIVSVSAVIILVVEPVTEVFFPLAARFRPDQDSERISSILTKSTKLALGASLPLAMALLVYGKDFILLWIGDDNLAIPSGVLALVVTSFTVTALALPATTILLAMGKAKTVFLMGLSELSLALVLVILTIRPYGLMGLACSLLAANVLISFGWIVPGVCQALKKSAGAFLIEAFLRPMYAAVLMLGTMYAISKAYPEQLIASMLVGTLCGGIVFAMAFYFLSLTRRERRMVVVAIKSAWKRPS